MRVVHVSDCYLPHVGGIELHLGDLAQHQLLEGHQVSVVTRTPDPQREGRSEALRVRSVSPEDLVALAPDVVHAHVSVVSPLAASTAARAAALGIPTVVTVHSLWSDLARIAPLVRAWTGLTRWPIVWTAVSEPAARQVERVVHRPVGVIPNAVDVDFWSSDASAGSGADAHPATVLSVMRLTTVKRTLPLARILHSVADRTDLSAVVVGDGPRRAALESYLHRHGLSTRVRVTGTLDRTAVRDAMARASVFLAPARRESFGIAALEARAMGLPVVAPVGSGVASFIGHQREGLLGRDDLELADHTAALVRDPELLRRITEHNRAVPPQHTWPAAVASNHEAYLLAGASGATPGRSLETAVGW